MNSLSRWANILGELCFSFLSMGIVLVMGLLKDQPVPLWGFFLAATLGGMGWNKVSYNRQKDFDKN